MDEGVRFEFGRCLGRGGFGEVYEAQMITLGGVRRTVAVKILNERFKDVESAIQRLRDEAHLLAALHHRAILQIHDLVDLDGRIALVAEYLPGADLDRIVRTDGRLHPRVALEIIGEVASALHAAYTAPSPGTSTPMRLVHRDIKPANIRVTPTGGVKLLDFGIARSPEVHREARTTTGIVVGTVGYFSPERLTEDLPQPADDVYALGCVLYEAVTGLRLYRKMKRADLFRLAFHPDNHAAFLRERLEHPPDGVPYWPALQPLLRQILASDPEERLTAGELEESCFDLLKDLNGPTLRQWSRKRLWPDPNFVAGAFEGQQLSSHSRVSTTQNLARRTTTTPPPPALPGPPTTPPRPRPLPQPASNPRPRRIAGFLGFLLATIGAGAAFWFAEDIKRLTGTAETAPLKASPAVAVPAEPPEPPPAKEPAPSAPPPEAIATGEAAPDAPAATNAAPAALGSRMPDTPDAEPPRPLPASLHGNRLLTLRDGRRLEIRDLASPAKSVQRLSDAPSPATSVCLNGDTMALVMGGTIELRSISSDTVVDRMRPGGRVVDRVLCLDDSEIVAVSRAPRMGHGGGTGEVIWWTSKGRIRGKLLPPAGVVDARYDGEAVLVLDGKSGLRKWTGSGGPSAEPIPLRGPPTGITPSLGGPMWALSTRTACSIDGTCVAVDGRRGLVASGVGWVAVGAADRITVINAIEGTVLRDIAAKPTALFAQADGTLLVVEPDGLRWLDPIQGIERKRRDW